MKFPKIDIVVRVRDGEIEEVESISVVAEMTVESVEVLPNVVEKSYRRSKPLRVADWSEVDVTFASGVVGMYRRNGTMWTTERLGPLKAGLSLRAYVFGDGILEPSKVEEGLLLLGEREVMRRLREGEVVGAALIDELEDRTAP